MCYRNCWMLVDLDANGNLENERTVYQQATALMLWEMDVRSRLEQGPTPGTVVLFWYDANGNRHLVAQIRIERSL